MSQNCRVVPGDFLSCVLSRPYPYFNGRVDLIQDILSTLKFWNSLEERNFFVYSNRYIRLTLTLIFFSYLQILFANCFFDAHISVKGYRNINCNYIISFPAYPGESDTKWVWLWQITEKWTAWLYHNIQYTYNEELTAKIKTKSDITEWFCSKFVNMKLIYNRYTSWN